MLRVSAHLSGSGCGSGSRRKLRVSVAASSRDTDPEEQSGSSKFFEHKKSFEQYTKAQKPKAPTTPESDTH